MMRPLTAALACRERGEVRTSAQSGSRACPVRCEEVGVSVTGEEASCLGGMLLAEMVGRVDQLGCSWEQKVSGLGVKVLLWATPIRA